MRKLSKHSDEAAGKIGKAMVKMADEIEHKFAVKLNQGRNNDESSQLVELQSQLSRLGEGYRKLDSLNMQILQQVSESGAQVAGEVLELISGVQFQDIVRQQIELVIKTITEGGEHMKALEGCLEDKCLCNTGVCRISEFGIEDVHKHYVMENQRFTHDSVADSTGGGARPQAVRPAAQSDVTFF